MTIMAPFDVLNVQNHQIQELSKVLSALIKERELCDTDIVTSLFRQYIGKVLEHIELNSKSIYTALLASQDAKVKAHTQRFMEGEQEIKKIFNSYVSRYCKHGLLVKDHAAFLTETEHMFRLVLKRMQAEFEELYPMVRRLEGASHALAA
jgi:hypothetical protein